MARSPADPSKPKKPAKPAKPRSFYVIYKGNLEGEPVITFDKEQAMDTLLEANASGDTSLKMKKMTMPKTTRPRAVPTNGAPSA